MSTINEVRELTATEIDDVVGGDVVGDTLGAYADGIYTAAATGALTTADTGVNSVNGLIVAADPGPAAQ